MKQAGRKFKNKQKEVFFSTPNVFKPYNTQPQDAVDATSIHGFKYQLDKFIEEKTHWGH